MIGYLKGKVINVSTDTAIILVGGVGYEVYCTGSVFSGITEGGECEVYTYLQVSEQNGVTLYGFSTIPEKTMFLNLISVSGVGPKMGLSVLTYMNLNDFATAVATGDVKRLSQVKGLGKKTAERIILELREKVGLPQLGSQPAAAPVVGVNSGDEDAVVALISLGFSRAESERAVSRAKAQGAKSVDEVILYALKGM